MCIVGTLKLVPAHVLYTSIDNEARKKNYSIKIFE
jgi:hypothetical protein